MKKTFAVLGMVLLAALLVFPGTAKSDMYIEGYLGGVALSNTSDPIDVPSVPFTFNAPGRFDNPFFTGGVKLGAWFDRTGIIGGYNWPDWAKYFGFYLDFNYHNADFKNQTVNILGFPIGNLSSRGRAATLAFMFAARYGFYPDSEVPFGRLQPYVAVGPALLFSSQRPHFLGFDLESKSSTDIALAVEAGVRWMALKNVSLDVSFKYRWANPSYNYNIVPGVTAELDPTYHIFIGAVGAAYHF